MSFMKMGMVEQAGSWDGNVNGSVMDLLDILDFPPESLEGDGFGDDFDASMLGPIPSDALSGFLPLPPTIIRDESPAFKMKASVDSDRLNTQLLNDVDENSRKALQNKYSDAQEAGMFQTESPVSVLESNASCSGGKAVVSAKTNSIVPVRTRSKRARSSTISPWLLISPISSAFESKKTSAAKRKQERKPSQKSIAKERDNDASDSVAKKCTHCEVMKTPQWREGPMGPKTLCNACGVRYRSGRLFPEYRPAASPTFVPSLHSNSHRKVVEMRRKAMQGEPTFEETTTTAFQESGRVEEEEEEPPPMSPLPEFVPMSSYLFDCI